MQPERAIVRDIVAYLSGRGAWTFKVHGGDNPFQQVGVPDILCCLDGRFVGVEVKLPGKKASPKQKVVLERIRKAGGIAIVADSVIGVERALYQTSRK